MRSLLKSRTAKSWRSSAFTLIEMMVSIAVMALFIVLIAQVVSGISGTWQSGARRINNFTKARAMLDLIDQDIQSGVFRKDLAAFPNSSAEFYTRRLGIGGVRNLTLVRYTVNTADAQSSLQRGDLPVNWGSTISFGNVANFGSNAPVAHDTAAGVLGFELIFLQQDGTLSRGYSVDTANTTRAVVVTLAVVDDQTIRQLAASGKAERLRAELKGAISGTRSIRADWEDYLRGKMSWASYPKNLATGLQIFERYVPLPSH